MWPFPMAASRVAAFHVPPSLPLPSLPALTSRNWYQNEVDEELKGVDAADTVKHTERIDQ